MSQKTIKPGDLVVEADAKFYAWGVPTRSSTNLPRATHEDNIMTAALLSNKCVLVNTQANARFPGIRWIQCATPQAVVFLEALSLKLDYGDAKFITKNITWVKCLHPEYGVVFSRWEALDIDQCLKKVHP